MSSSAPTETALSTDALGNNGLKLEQAQIRHSSISTTMAFSKTNMKTSKKKNNSETLDRPLPAKAGRTKEQCRPLPMITGRHKATKEPEALPPHNCTRQESTGKHSFINNGSHTITGNPKAMVRSIGTHPASPITRHTNGPPTNKTGVKRGAPPPPPLPTTLNKEQPIPPPQTHTEEINQATHLKVITEAAPLHLQRATETTLTTATFNKVCSCFPLFSHSSSHNFGR